MKKINLSILIYLTSTVSVFAQLDTLQLLKNINKKYTTQSNGFVEFTTNYSSDELNGFTTKKVWFIKDKSLSNIVSLRVENYNKNEKQIASIHILNEKQKYYINPVFKRSDLSTFVLLKGEELDNFYLKTEQENIPTFMLKEGEASEMAVSLYNDIKLNENLFFEILKDTIIDNIDCFGIGITDYDKNNGYIADINQKGNERYADKTIENTYFNKKDTTIILKTLKYIYKKPNTERVFFEHINSQLMNDKKNTSMHLYTIKTDTLKHYFKTITKYNGNAFIPYFDDFTIKKSNIFEGLTIENKKFKLDQINSKLILLGFWSTDCEDCLMQLHAIDEQYDELNKLGFTFIAINSSEKADIQMKEFLKEKGYSFTIIFSKEAGKMFQSDKDFLFLLLNEKFEFKDIYNELNQNIVDKIMKKLK